MPDNGSIAVANKNFPDRSYPSNLDCTWSIKNEEGRRMWISFHDFSTEWRKDFLSMGNGAPQDRNRTSAIITMHSGTHMPDPYEFTSSGDEVIIALVEVIVFYTSVCPCVCFSVLFLFCFVSGKESSVTMFAHVSSANI